MSQSKADSSSSNTPLNSSGSSKVDVLKGFLPLWPFILGFASARISLVVTNYGSYTSTDEGILTDGSMFVALFILGLFFMILFVKKPILRSTFVDRLGIASMVGEAIIAGVLSVLSFFGWHYMPGLLTISALSALFATGAICYWIRRVKSSTSTTTAVFLFFAICLSEIVIYICGFLPKFLCEALVVFFALAQIPCIFKARKQIQPYEINIKSEDSGYFGFTKAHISDNQFLLATFVGVALLSVVVGLLRGYPDGLPIAFTPATRFIYIVLTILLSIFIMVYAVRGKYRIMTVGIWIIMQALACFALLAYAAFPNNLAVGAIFTITLSSIMSGFVLYVIIAFMSYGWRDPYFYATLGLMVWLGFRGLARIGLLSLYSVYSNDLFMNASMAVMLMISTQVVFTLFIKIYRQDEVSARKVESEKKKPIQKLLGLDTIESQSTARLASMRRNSEELGHQFLLSKREIEVLSLYALGFTQKRVAEELFISPATVHAHIKRIYTKTGMHSRQEILDYMQRYTS